MFHCYIYHEVSINSLLWGFACLIVRTQDLQSEVPMFDSSSAHLPMDLFLGNAVFKSKATLGLPVINWQFITNVMFSLDIYIYIFIN